MAQSPQSTVEYAIERIREGILAGRYGPGEKLWQDRLAKEFNISRIPVREALVALASEGLVTLLRNRGAMVPALSKEDLDELYSLGAMLEKMAATRATRRLEPEDLAHMKDILERMRNSRDDVTNWYALNEQFHSIIIRACGWPRLIELVFAVRHNLGRYLCIATRPAFDANVKEWDREHLALYRACEARDSTRVGQLVQHHWRRTRGVLAKAIGEIATPKRPRAPTRKSI